MSLPRVWSAVCAQARARAGAYLRPARRHHGRGAAANEAAFPAAELTFDPATAHYYAILELPYGASADEVRAARRLLLGACHPDRFPHDPDRAQTAYTLAQKLNEAHDELLDILEVGCDD